MVLGGFGWFWEDLDAFFVVLGWSIDGFSVVVEVLGH